jgi:Mrp family chromosome partitioning ATPase
MLAGCRRGVGCTTLALALARAAARTHAVLLLDGDLQQSGLEERSVAPSWPSHDVSEGLAFPSLRYAAAPRERLLDATALRAWQARLRQDYALSVLDGGSVWESAERWAPWVDAVLLVCDAGQKWTGDWARASDRLEDCGVHVLGLVETFG